MSDSEQTKPDNENVDSLDVEVIPLSVSPTTPFLSDFTDMNSSSDIDDGDDEGIFAAAPAKKKSSGALMWFISAVSIVGVGGYLVMKSPETLQLIKDNLTGKVSEVEVPISNVLSAESALSLPVEGAMTAPAPLVEPSVIAGTPVLTEQVGSVADGASVPPSDVIAPLPNPLPNDAAVPPLATVGQDMAPIIELPAANNQQIVLASPDADVAKSAEVVLAPIDSAPIVPAEAAPVVLESKQDSSKIVTDGNVAPKDTIIPVVKNEKAEELKDKAIEPLANVTPQVTTEKTPVTAVVKEISQKEMSEKEAGKASIDAAMNNPKRANVEDDVPVVDVKTVYFDSPEGKMMKDIPAPSMNVSKGKGESIIIVTNPFEAAASKKVTKGGSKDVMTVTSTDLEPQILAASRAMKLERYAAAQDIYDDLYRQNKRDGRILMGRAILLQKTGQNAGAIAAYEELLNVDPENAEAVVNFAGLIRKEHPAMALNKLLDLKEKYPNNTAVLAQLGITYADSGNFEDAFSNLSHAAQLDQNNPQHYYNLGVISERAHDTMKAILYYEKALEVDAVYGTGRNISRDKIYDRLAVLRGR